MHDNTPKVVLVGGGLANSLIALRLMELRPEVDFVLLEQGETLGAQHTWSFFQGDIDPQIRAWLDPLIAHRWGGYQVRFPRRRRTLGAPYASITSDRLDAVLRPRFGARCILGATAMQVTPHQVALADGRLLTADLVIDGRGPQATPDLELGFQKFIGQVVRLEQPHGLKYPIIMDATVPQLDGYRFVYVLPLTEHSVLIEDTRYTDGEAVDRGNFRSGIRDYAAAQGWRIADIEAEEEGVLPVALDGDIEAFWARAGDVPQVGLRAALFHPTTGYSLPDAARLAERIAAEPVFTSEAIGPMIRARSIETWNERGFFRLCNRMLFRAAVPALRFRVFQRFYGLSDRVIGRFYADRLTWFDRARILTGKPPVPMAAAIACIGERKQG